MGVTSMRAEANKIGFQLKSVDTGNSTIARWACTCSKCGIEHVTSHKAFNTTPELLSKTIQSQGWEYQRRQLVCPTCIAKAKEEKKMSNVTTKIEAANPKLQRKVFALLDDHFNETTGFYEVGWSDKKIAESAQTSEQYVANLRKGAYRDLAEDPAITALRGEIADLEARSKTLTDALMTTVDEIEKKIAALNTRLDGYAMKKVS